MNSDKNLGGMTVNERLFALSLLEEYDAAVKRKDKSQIISILKQCDLTEEQASASAQQTLEPTTNPPYFKRQARKLLFNYLIIYPFYYVISMGLATLSLWWLLGWEDNYALVWFKILALIMGGASYFIHWRIGLFALMDSFRK
jgi:hypothetical protein